MKDQNRFFRMVGQLSLFSGRSMVAIHKAKDALDQRYAGKTIGIMAGVAEFAPSDGTEADWLCTIPGKVSV
jgi:hypothetical protein